MTTTITHEQLVEMMQVEQRSEAPSGAGYWIMSHDDWAQIAKMRVPFGGYLVYFPPDENRLTHLFGLPILVVETDAPIRFVLWCEHCGRYLRWDGSCRCQHCYNYVPCPAPLRWLEAQPC